MSEEPEKRRNKPTASEKEARLKDALRANLRRRKAAARKSRDNEADAPELNENGSEAS